MLELQTENRALREVLAGTETARRATRCAGASARSCASSCGGPRRDGSMRADFAPEDMPLVFMTAGRVLEAARPVAPDLWRRYLGLLLDGLRAEGATPLPRGPLTGAQVNRLLDRDRR